MISDEFDRGVQRANRDSRNGPQWVRLTVKFICSDCGRRRAGHEHLVCQLCSADVCDACQEGHLRQHPIEARRR
jgi:hypothetical protein